MNEWVKFVKQTKCRDMLLSRLEDEGFQSNFRPARSKLVNDVAKFQELDNELAATSLQPLSV